MQELEQGYAFTKEQLSRLETLERENAQMKAVIAEQKEVIKGYQVDQRDDIALQVSMQGQCFAIMGALP